MVMTWIYPLLVMTKYSVATALTTVVLAVFAQREGYS
jgi:hypothetical protein